MSKITIVTHCYSSPEVPIYHKLLWLQHLSLCQYDWGDLEGDLWVCFSSTDNRTLDTLGRMIEMDLPKNYRIHLHPQTKSHLFRRAIGRNDAALKTDADVVWFTDVDHFFRDQSLHQAVSWSLIKQSEGVDLVWPERVNIHKTHRRGDLVIDGAFDLGLSECIADDFTLRKEKKAIGGLQIVNGGYCRKHGYLNGTGWVAPVESSHFLRCRCDVPFRSEMTKQAVPIDGVYRVRHSQAGRDQGQIDHGLKTV